MPYLTPGDFQNRVQDHLEAALEKYHCEWFVIVAQGSMNYHLTDEESDCDTKLLTIPSLEELVLGQKPLNVTYVLEDETDEHCDVKDFREYFKTFRKQNINFVEILFSDYWIVNPMYEDLWLELRSKREELAHMNPYAAVSCMMGMAREKRHALSHKYPSKRDTIEKFGYDPKQLHHLWRLYNFINAYVDGWSYEECLFSSEFVHDEMMQCKRDGLGLPKELAEEEADAWLAEIEKVGNEFRSTHENILDEDMNLFLNKICYNVVTRSLRWELMN